MLIRLVDISGFSGLSPAERMDDETFKKEIAKLQAEIDERSIYRDQLYAQKYGAPNPAAMTPEQYAYYSQFIRKLEQINDQIARLKDDGDDTDMPPE